MFILCRTIFKSQNQKGSIYIYHPFKMSQLRLRQIKQLDQDPMLVNGKAETQTQVSLPLNIYGLNHNSILPLTYLT